MGKKEDHIVNKIKKYIILIKLKDDSVLSNKKIVNGFNKNLSK